MYYDNHIGVYHGTAVLPVCSLGSIAYSFNTSHWHRCNIRFIMIVQLTINIETTQDRMVINIHTDWGEMVYLC